MMPFKIPETPPVCPECGSECESIYMFEGSPIGCDCCIDVVDAYEWQYDQAEAAYDAYIDQCVDEAIEERHERSN